MKQTHKKAVMRVMFVQTNTDGEPLLQPIGPAMVAAQLKRDGHEVLFVDLMGEQDPVAAARDAALTFRPDLVCYTVRNRDNQSPIDYFDPMPGIRAVVDGIREVAPVPSLLGGTAFTTFPVRVMEALNADYGLAGDDLEAVSHFVASLAGDAADVATPGLVYRDATGKVVENPYKLRGYADVPFDHHVLIDQNRYREALWQAAVVTRTGCPEKCAYCDSFHTFGSNFLLREPGVIAEELLALKQTGKVRAIYLVDGGFNRPLDHAKAVLEAIIRLDVQLQLYSVFDPGQADDEFFRLYRRAGGIMVNMFAESLSDQVLAELGKSFTVSDVLRDADAIQRAGVNIMWMPTFGGPGETTATFTETLTLAPRMRAALTKMDIGWRIQPRTPLRDRAVREGLLTADDDCWEPHFYISPHTPLAWIEEQLRAYHLRNPSAFPG